MLIAHGTRIMDNTFHPLVSIVIPVYNGANYLAEAIESAIAQSYDNIEILVINDGSNDDGVTEKIALSYGDRIRYFRKENGGVSSALNFGIREMRGDYFSWLSHDDRYLPRKVETQIEWLSRSEQKDVVLYGNIFLIDASGRRIGRTKHRDIPTDRFREHLLMDHIANGCSMLIPRSVFSQGALFREDLHITQDIDLWFRLSDRYDFVLITESLVEYRIFPEQGSRRMTARAFEKDLIFRRMLDVVLTSKKERDASEVGLLFFLFAVRLLAMGHYKPSMHAFAIAERTISSSPASIRLRECYLRLLYRKRVRDHLRRRRAAWAV